MVTLIEASGNPLMNEVRLVPLVCTPGCVTSRSMPPRLTNGKSATCRCWTVLETVALVACTSSPPAVTSTVSVTGPLPASRHRLRHARVELDVSRWSRCESP